MSLGFPCGLAGRETTCNMGDMGSAPELGRSPGEWDRLPTPVFSPGELYGLYSSWGHKESDTTVIFTLGSIIILVYLSNCLCHLQFFFNQHLSFQSTGLLPP